MQTSESLELGGGNRLAGENSPYLLQHANNPVDWYPWGEEAFAKARQEDKPIFLSIGYSACHWCHVMERESFEDVEIAGLLNAHFVAIKVDREEHPEIDTLYMTAVQMLTGSGGWPMSVFLTPDLKPFFGGTYFPPRAKPGQLGFLELLGRLQAVWAGSREAVEKGAEEIRRALVGQATARTTGPTAAGLAVDELADQACRQAQADYDGEFGGFGEPPKFPPTGMIELLLRRSRRPGDAEAALGTLAAMACGGLYDQLGGGFHRYSVDRQWLVPHFEKMLYDNALLAPVYLDAYQMVGWPLFRRVAVETLDFMLRELADPAGGLHAALDADSEGEEGRYYLWTAAEIESHLPAAEVGRFGQLYGVTANGNFEGRNILHLRRPTTTATTEQLEIAVGELAEARATLLDKRSRRGRPNLDDKCLAGWNGLALRALARGGAVLALPRFLEAGDRLARFARRELWRDGRLLRCYRRGVAKLPGCLEDYAYLADGLIELFLATGSGEHLQFACQLGELLSRDFADPEQDGFFNTTSEHPHLLVRDKEFHDQATPAAGLIAARVLLRLARLTGDEQAMPLVESTLAAAAAAGRRYPFAFPSTWNVHHLHAAERQEVVLALGQAAGSQEPWRRIAYARYLPNADRLLLPAGADCRPTGELARLAPMVAGRHPQEGRTTAYLCRGKTCLPPLTTPADLDQELATWR